MLTSAGRVLRSADRKGGILMLHELKTDPKVFHSTAAGIKAFEFRKNDRNFKVNDIVILREYDMLTGYTGSLLLRRITYILIEGFGLPAGYCIFSVRPLTEEEESFHAAGIKPEQRRDVPAISQ